ncbi:protein-glutamate methylesterase/protein-glutamine glutaminase [Holophaga foetida]|uniref:protein-glutamate methylesterase/protein-glutamine glutaminase n=1 Tax=Holophaga foetida TaxID=35839 RepID=UPI0002472A59|nr:chemotaxis response regulator protein-glutamate methylesterase [Holophaga foetida]
MPSPDLNVLVVDDTIVYRKILSEVLESLEGVQLIGTASQGRLALARMEQTPADLVLLDVEMPEMDGLETLGHLRRRWPDTDVVMISGTNMSSAEITVQALEQGALDFIRKPEGADPEASRQELRDKLRPLIRHIGTRRNMRAPAAPRPAPLPPPPPPVLAKPPLGRIEVVGIGVSTGGPNALAELIPLLPADFPVPILVVQHMPPTFTASLAEHLDRRSHLRVCEAQEGEPIQTGSVYIAPGGKHMVVRRHEMGGGNGCQRIIGINENPPENSCRPSVDVLFRSMAAQYDKGIAAVIMTGMGNDGCEGVRTLKRRGCHCLTQSAETCVVYGMPMAVDEAGLSDEQIPLPLLAQRLVRLVREGGIP